jgi:hypothetical protein
MDTLVLAPLDTTRLVDTYEEAAILREVQTELGNPHTTITYVDPRGLNLFRYYMHFSRLVGSLPANQLTCLKWLRMCDYAGIPFALMGRNYREYLHQAYTGCLNGDGKAGVEFKALFNGEWVTDHRHEVQAKCLDHLTPHFHDVLNDVVGQIRKHVINFPQGAFALWGRQTLGLPTSNSRMGGWANF